MLPQTQKSLKMTCSGLGLRCLDEDLEPDEGDSFMFLQRARKEQYRNLPVTIDINKNVATYSRKTLRD